MSGYLLDTNVISELRKGPRKSPDVAAWIDKRSAPELFLSVVTLAEIRRGIYLIRKRDPSQADVLERWWRQVELGFNRAGHLLSIQSREAEAWAALSAIRPLPVMDGFLAATAVCHGLTLVTRNVVDFVDLPVTVENPFAPTR